MAANLKNFFIEPAWPAPANIKAFSSLRQSGVSSPTGINHAALKQHLQLPGEPVWIKQVHGARAVKALPENNAREADAIFTDSAGTVCAVQTADCLPVLITDKKGTHVAAVHAGWRGLLLGVIEATIAKLGLPHDDLLVWFGPAIGPHKFEVRKDVYDAFTLNNKAAEQGFDKISAEHWLGNLYFLAQQRLHKIGVNNIYGGEFCTHTDQERFYSYRRDGKLLGRIVNVIWMAEKNPNL